MRVVVELRRRIVDAPATCTANYNRELVNVLEDLVPAEATMKLRWIPVAKLTSGMVLEQEIRPHGGLLLVTKGQEVTHPLLIKLANYMQDTQSMTM